MMMLNKLIIVLAALLLQACGGGDSTPTAITQISQAVGTWTVNYTGGDNGSCAVTVLATGNVTGTCQSQNTASAFTVAGNVTNDGTLSIAATTGATALGGKLYVSTGEGSWTNTTAKINGNWTANKTSTTTTATSPYKGTWNVTISGMDSGACNGLVISDAGNIASSYCSTYLAGGFYVTGSVSSTGAVTVRATTGALSLSGTMGTVTNGTGSWYNGSYSGTWVASKQ